MDNNLADDFAVGVVLDMLERVVFLDVGGKDIVGAFFADGPDDMVFYRWIL